MQISQKSGSKLNITEQLYASVYIRQLRIAELRPYFIKCGVDPRGLESDDNVLAIAHHARMKLADATPKEKSASEEWLRSRQML